MLGIRLLQGYGLTETSACGAIMAFDQNTVGDVGPPVQGVNIRLVACLFYAIVFHICIPICMPTCAGGQYQVLVACLFFTFACFFSRRLVDWEEGNYRVTDRPRPRGEVEFNFD